MHVSRKRKSALARTVLMEGEKELRCREMLKEALESFSPEGLEPGREISAISRDGTLVLVYIPARSRGIEGTGNTFLSGGLPMKVLVCGGRDFDDYYKVAATLDLLHRESPISVLIHGAARGADSLASRWARKNNVAVREFPAQWEFHGRAAGPAPEPPDARRGRA